ERADLLARAGGGTAQQSKPPPPSPAQDKALADALAEVQGLEGPEVPEVDDEIAAMTVEEIERILEETRRKL
ncbi:MAG: hypothetical protein JRJ84_20015, partial [Deltaproteobacteria bacterium]|nr:hypothetical protein [Deltaproteobacteria bacterium]